MKTKQDVIDTIAKQRVVEGIVKNIAGDTFNREEYNLNDLSQDIYVDLLSKNDDKIVEMYNNDQLKFFITRIVLNNVYSKNSPYYSKYKKLLKKSNNIDDYADKL